MMKQTLTTILLSLLFAVATAVQPPKVIVRTTFDASYPNVCTLTEYASVFTSVRRRRNLRTERRLENPWWCCFYCEHFPPGSCHIAYPQCQQPSTSTSYCNARRLEENEEISKDETRRKLPGNSLNSANINSGQANDCNAAEAQNDADIDAAINANNTVSDECMNVLLSKRTHLCMELRDYSGYDGYDDALPFDELQNASPEITVTNKVDTGHGSCGNGAKSFLDDDWGTLISYCITVKNTGNTPLKNITVIDSALNLDETIDLLNTGDEQLYTIDSSIQADLTNTVYVTAIPCDYNNVTLVGVPEQLNNALSEVKGGN